MRKSSLHLTGARRRVYLGLVIQPILGSIFDLSNPAEYVHWHFFQMSVANIVVILLMIAVFILAILIPFPKRPRI